MLPPPVSAMSRFLLPSRSALESCLACESIGSFSNASGNCYVFQEYLSLGSLLGFQRKDNAGRVNRNFTRTVKLDVVHDAKG